jgi:hypothetical protein
LNSRQANREIYLYIYTLSIFNSRPVLFVEENLSSFDKLRKTLVTEKCYKTANRQLNSRTLTILTLSESADKIYFRLLSLFINVFCFFTDDVRKFRPIVQCLAFWLDLGQLSTLSKSICLKVLIMIKQREDALDDDKSDLKIFKQMLSKETIIDISEQFSDIWILSLTICKRNLSNKAHYWELFEQLLNFSDQVQKARVNSQTLFSVYYFVVFFHYTLNHITATLVKPFNFIVISQIENLVTRNL